ncbi:hypothetical protein R6Q59_027203 [Mikania micrantha]
MYVGMMKLWAKKLERQCKHFYSFNFWAYIVFKLTFTVECKQNNWVATIFDMTNSYSLCRWSASWTAGLQPEGFEIQPDRHNFAVEITMDDEKM